jgi:hypothetical protein
MGSRITARPRPKEREQARASIEQLIASWPSTPTLVLGRHLDPSSIQNSTSTASTTCASPTPPLSPPTSGNTNGAVLAVAERAASLITREQIQIAKELQIAL